jgi:sugar phosphate permease
LALAGLGQPLAASLSAAIIGLTLIGVGTFFAQAAATGFVGRPRDRRPRFGERHLFFGGLVGTAVLGQLSDHFGWAACVSGIALAPIVAALLAYASRSRATERIQEAPMRKHLRGERELGIREGVMETVRIDSNLS